MLDQDDFKFRSPVSLKFRNSLWFAGLLLLTYIVAIVLANYLITHYGQIALPFVAFALIPFDLVIRDLMQDHWLNVPTQYVDDGQVKRDRYYLLTRMAAIILLGAFVSWVSGTGSLRVNIASCLAFIVAGSIDALTYQWMVRYGRILRINGATLTAAITDSIIFVTIAFSSVNWKLVGLQIGMKIVGGFVWSLLLFKLFCSSKPNFPKMPDLRTDYHSYADDLGLPFKPQIWGRDYDQPRQFEIRLPEPGVVDKQGNIYTQECVDDMRRQIAEGMVKINLPQDGFKDRSPRRPIAVLPRPDCWLCFGGGYKGQICQCHHHPPGRLSSLSCNLRCNK